MNKKRVFLTLIFFISVFSVSAATDITTCTDITSSGEYHLIQDITDSDTARCIEIRSHNVVLDCLGNTVDGNNDANYGIYVELYDNITIKNCVVTDWDFAGVHMSGSENSSLENLNVSRNLQKGIRLLSGSDNNQIVNINSSANGDDGIQILDSSNNQFNDIIASHNNASGIDVDGSRNNLINVIANSNEDSGVQIKLVSHNQFTNITTLSNGNDGISLGGGSGSTTNNTFTNIKSKDNTDKEIDDDSSSGGGTGINYLFYDTSDGQIEWLDESPSGFLRDLTIEGDLELSNTIVLSNNFAFVNTTALIGKINSSTIITLKDITLDDPKPQVDLEDDGSFVDCTPFTNPACHEISYADDIFVFNTTHFTGFQSAESSGNGGEDQIIPEFSFPGLTFALVIIVLGIYWFKRRKE